MISRLIAVFFSLCLLSILSLTPSQANAQEFLSVHVFTDKPAYTEDEPIFFHGFVMGDYGFPTGQISILDATLNTEYSAMVIRAFCLSDAAGLSALSGPGPHGIQCPAGS